MTNRLYEVSLQINKLKKMLGCLWESKGRTDEEILNLAEKIDQLLNEYDQLLKYPDDCKN
jgi:hypothetical protein